jgi:hypothetical protein
MSTLLNDSVRNRYQDPLSFLSYRYQTVRHGDGTLRLLIGHQPKGDFVYDVCACSESQLLAAVPPKSGRSLLKRFPFDFRLSQVARDCVVLEFHKAKLDELAGPLRIRKRRRASADTRARLCRMSFMNSPFLNPHRASMGGAIV